MTDIRRQWWFRRIDLPHLSCIFRQFCFCIVTVFQHACASGTKSEQLVPIFHLRRPILILPYTLLESIFSNEFLLTCMCLHFKITIFNSDWSPPAPNITFLIYFDQVYLYLVKYFLHAITLTQNQNSSFSFETYLFQSGFVSITTDWLTNWPTYW